MKKKRFHKLMSFVKGVKDGDQRIDQNMAEKQSPQSPNIPDIKPEKEAELVNRFRTALAKKKGRSLLYETE